jgi:hypothetical protein
MSGGGIRRLVKEAANGGRLFAVPVLLLLGHLCLHLGMSHRERCIWPIELLVARLQCQSTY